MGRFLSVDPLVGNPLNAQDYNGYSYCANNPLAFTDPSGYQKYATPEVYCIPGSEFYLNRIFGGGGGGGIGGGGDGGASGYSGMGSLDYGLPGQGQNGPGANGLYYDWVSGTMRSTATLQPANYEVIDHFFQTKYTHSDGSVTYGEKTFSYTSLKVAYDISPANAKSGGGVDFSLAIMYSHFQDGGGKPLTINMSSIDFSGTSQRELGLTGMRVGESRPVNLFKEGVLNPAALAFGRVNMTYYGNNQFSIVGDNSSRFDFSPLIDPSASLGRNAGNILGAAINYNMILGPVSLYVSISGGPYDVNFVGTTTIPK